jgi:branched-chain amino acid transport system permease protein
MSAASRRDSAPRAGRARSAWIKAALALLCLCLPLFTNDYTQYVANMMLVFVLVTLGFNVVIGFLGQLAFCNAAFFGIGAYASGIFANLVSSDFLGAWCAGTAAGALAGLVVGLPALRLSGYYLAIVTLAFGELMRWTYVHADRYTQGATGLMVPVEKLFAFPLADGRLLYFVFLAITVLLIWLTLNLLRSRFGRDLVAIRNNEAAALALGIAASRFKVAAFVWSGLLVGAAGAMFAALSGRITPESFNLHQLLLQFAMVMVGGLGSVVGSILGAVVLTATPELLRNFPGMEEIFFSFLLIFVLLFMPRGIGGFIARRSPVLDERLFRR